MKQVIVKMKQKLLLKMKQTIIKWNKLLLNETSYCQMKQAIHKQNKLFPDEKKPLSHETENINRGGVEVIWGNTWPIHSLHREKQYGMMMTSSLY